MKFLYVALLITLVGLSTSQPLEEEFEYVVDDNFFDDEISEDELSQYNTTAQLNLPEDEDYFSETTISPVDNRFSGGRPVNSNAGCTLTCFVVERTRKKGKLTEFIFRRASLRTGTKIGDYIVTAPAEYVSSNEGRQLACVVGKEVYLVKARYIFSNTIAVLTFCKPIRGLSNNCVLPVDQICSTPCLNIPNNVDLTGFKIIGRPQNQPEKTLEGVQASPVQCPNSTPNRCCLKPNGNAGICPEDKGAAVSYNGVIYGIIDTPPSQCNSDVISYVDLSQYVVRILQAVANGRPARCGVTPPSRSISYN